MCIPENETQRVLVECKWLKIKIEKLDCSPFEKKKEKKFTKVRKC